MESRKQALALMCTFLLACSATFHTVTPAPTGPIKTIVLLVMENRSFDHFVGLMKKLNPEIDGLTGTEDNPVNPADPSAPRIRISDMAEFVDPDPGHEYEQVAEQIYGSIANVNAGTTPEMNGFVAQAEQVRSNTNSLTKLAVSQLPTMRCRIINGSSFL